MRKIKIKNFISFRWLLWLLLVVLWNFGYPQATPLQDVIIAVILSLVFIFFKNQID
mgnify:CR=1 FL=1|jgi:hypothetical protein|tara:strand:+ start:13816 stop:13983 length:168 start_codon:yes stop_codon:yes gene_type:complete